jgi:tRNA pseudouridine55 synthase
VNADGGDYLLPVDKPEGPTSHDVVAAARRALATRKIGHTGTLDPFASGLLVLCVGGATRLSEYLTSLDKTYVAVARLGVSTDTLDRDGEIVATSDGWRGLTLDDVERALAGLRGDIEQVPPQFSAKKVAGEAMHRRARRGETTSLPPIPVTVHGLDLLGFEPPLLRLEVRCSSGTYVRALARDLGAALGVGAHLVELRRTAVGRFDVADAVTLEELDTPEAVRRVRVEPLDALAHLPTVEVEGEAMARLRHGQRIVVDGDAHVRIADAGPEAPSAGPRLVSVSRGRDLVAMGELDAGVLRPRKVFSA